MNNSQTDLYEGLNSTQKEAVMCTEGPSLIIAGAGSGKTRVLTCRVAHILEGGCRPGEVLALTFTKKAATEMQQRIATLVGEKKARWIQMGTFHSIFIRFLRQYADRLGYPEQFTIYDKTDSVSIVRQCIKELQLDDKNYKASLVHNRISLAKNNLITVEGYRSDTGLIESDRAARRPRTCDIYELYQKKCKTSGAMDFDDILLNTNILLRYFPDARAEIASRFRYIMVDEYQDTNHAQYVILKKLAESHRNICVVGDDSQSIYSFRGARIENILKFKKDYPEAREFRLEQNYRSTQNIVEAANSLIEHNERRLKKQCFSCAERGEKLGLIKAFTESEEAQLIASSIIEKIYATKSSYDSFAILYRTNAQSRAMEEALRKRNLPYRVYGSRSFYERAEIKDMFAYFKLIVNQKDDESFRRVVNVPARGIGETTLEKLTIAANSHECSLYNATMLPLEDLLTAGLKEAAVKKLRTFTGVLEALAEKSETTDCYELALEVGNASGYLAALHSDNSPEGISRFENVEELFSSIKSYSEEESEMREILAEDEEGMASVVTLSDYLENVYLMSAEEKDDTQDPDKENSNKIVLMTVHASKGLEFPYVYVAGMEENLFPSQQSDTPDKIEEERRLFYVAITRAEKAVTLSYAQNRRKWGSEESCRPSRFLKEIDRQYYAVPIDTDENRYDPFPSTRFSRSDFETYRRPSDQHTQRTPRQVQTPQPQRPSFSPPTRHTPSPDFVPDAISDLKVGQRVEHDRFGYGTILSFDGEGANMKAVVDFENSGRKTLLLKFAKLRIVL